MTRRKPATNKGVLLKCGLINKHQLISAYPGFGFVGPNSVGSSSEVAVQFYFHKVDKKEFKF
jgi:hypothetical protein